jgi:hypothetical protein
MEGREMPSRSRVLIATGVGMTVVAATYVATMRNRSPATDKRRALITYLREHLSGADFAIIVVDRLRYTHAGTREGGLFARLSAEFKGDRDVVRALLGQLGASDRSVKRLASHASAAVISLTAGGEPGDLSLLRTLEALSIGVQGKRCMWRALQAVETHVRPPTDKSFSELESKAVEQWDAIEERRSAVAAKTFPLRD